jgi:hypothetical protein
MKTSKRAVLMIAAIASLMPLGGPGAEAAVFTNPDTSAAPGLTTAFDRAIDLMVQQRVLAEKLAPADALVAREQLQFQFLSLSKAEQQNVLAAAQNLDSQEAVITAMRVLNNAVSNAARQALAEAQAARQSKQGIQPKLGADGDLVFVATPGPCRVYDSRFGPGPLGPGLGRQIYAYSNVLGYPWGLDQGGIGTAGAGNCVGTVYGGTPPISVVATVTVVNTFSTGAVQAWNGGTVLSGGAVLNWNAGERLSNTTVIPVDRSIAPFPGSGFKRDFALFNNSGNAIDNVVDVVGYFIENRATPLDCTRVLDTDFSLGAGLSILRTAPACPAGYTAMMGMPATNVFGVYTGTILENQCRINNATGALVNNLRCDAHCCRLPGR